MKKTTFTLLLSLSCCWLVAQCPTDDIIFFSQGQIDSFPLNYPGFSKIAGDINISGSSITNLDRLSEPPNLAKVELKACPKKIPTGLKTALLEPA